MINTVRIEDRPYRLYNNITNESIKFSNIDELKKWIAGQIGGISWFNRGDKHILEDINMTFNDIVSDLDQGYRIRKYTILDSLNRIIDIRVYRKEIEELVKSKKYIPHRPSKLEHIQFRRDPIPGIRKLRTYNFYRPINNITNEKRQSSDPSIQHLIRAARKAKNLPDPWDDYRIHLKYGWKQTKVKKQYMRHWKHNKTTITSLREINRQKAYREAEEAENEAA